MTRFPKILTVTLSLIAACSSAFIAQDGAASRSVISTRHSNGSLNVRSATALAPDPSVWLTDVQSLMVANYEAGVARQERADAEAARVEAQNVAGDQARDAAPNNGRIASGGPAPAATPTSGDCANPVVPEYVAMRESGCRWDAVNPNGCSGRSCVGFYQLDLGHFAAVSPWNPNVPGSCFGLDWHSQADQIECASRLGPGAWAN